jgi:hypothetical protein
LTTSWFGMERTRGTQFDQREKSGLYTFSAPTQGTLEPIGQSIAYIIMRSILDTERTNPID